MKTYTGGCHCKKVRFEADIENLDTVISCNCSMCAKRGWLLAFVPASSFRLLSGEDALTEYRFNQNKIQHLFCSTCGTASFGRGNDAEGNEMISINIRCLDDIDVDTLTVTPYNGKDV
jgi:hypothetical protein